MRRYTKASARAQALESKVSIGHYLEAVPLTADERAIVEGDLAKLDGLIRKLDDVPTLDGRTPSQIEAKKTDNLGHSDLSFLVA
ncbi:site-specific recombinase [Pseudomonas avellanae]|uniref:Site-specific recombinase n=2 Tax=Pseudomonas syringae group TaxID=136849 RepID=A0A261WLH1_9PSED|nr:site-specific recombinase [Pseudomonas syringae pv. actinidiae]NYS41340.1 site-specific recombinase [Pseudomonas syringae pv. actinidiae]OZI86965.1 site-specific recombinase [Pseudomonas avellanae]PIN58219.1 site-specific recombinase [Pseudomonas syringae pv. actinidiae]GAO95230.1 hypothetical protein PSA5_20955 [Pseudomonas syringae pv. actinidiae]